MPSAHAGDREDQTREDTKPRRIPRARHGAAPEEAGTLRLDQGGSATGAPGSGSTYPEPMPASPGWAERAGLESHARREDREGVDEAERRLAEGVGPRREIRGGHDVRAGGNELDER